MPLAFAGALALLSALAFAPSAAALEQKLTASDGVAQDRLGFAVAVDGDTIVVGVPQKNTYTGAVYAYQRVGDTWTQTATLTASDGAQYDQFGSSVAIDGDTIVAGAPTDRFGESSDQGSVYTFARTGTAARTETAKLTASDGAQYDKFGNSVAIDGDTIVAGAPGDAVGSNGEQGSVYTFARTGDAARTQTAKLTASDGAYNDMLGYSVAIDGDTIVAGARLDSIGVNPDQGSVYTFARTGAAARTETAKLTAADGAAADNGLDDNLGSSVGIDGDTIVAGAPYDDVGANVEQMDRGSVYTFASTGAAARTETARLTASDTGAFLGYAVAIDGDTIAGGIPEASGEEVGTLERGSIYTFARTGAAARTETAKLTASDARSGDWLGFSVAVDDDTIVAGAIHDDVGTNANQGSASVFFSPPDADDDGVPDAADDCPNGASSGLDTDGDGCKDTSEDGDDDNDTVSDVSDQCRTLAASTPSGCPGVNRSLTLSYSAKKQKFKGKLSASNPSCVTEDLVTVWEKRGGDDAQVGTGEVNESGQYVVSRRGRPGKYYATVDARVVTDVAACKSALSPTLRLP